MAVGCTVVGPVAVGCSCARSKAVLRSFYFLSDHRLTAAAGEFHFYRKQKRYKSENGLHTARARHRPALPAVAPWPVPLLKRHGVELAHDARAVCGRADHPLARPVMLLSWRAALALARGADMLLGPACSSHTLALMLAPLSDMRGVVPT